MLEKLSEKQVKMLDVLRMGGIGLTNGEIEPLSRDDFALWVIMGYLNNKKASALDGRRRELTEEEIDTAFSARGA